MAAAPDSSTLADQADFDLLRDELATDLQSALAAALNAGVSFESGSTPLQIFRAAVAATVRDIQEHPTGRLLGRFLRHGPLVEGEPVSAEVLAQRLTDDETANAIRFIHSSMINTFKGLLAELLAAPRVAAVVDELQRRGSLPPTARVFAGDVVQARMRAGLSWAKAADFHILTVDPSRAVLHGVAEVKSFPRPRKGLMAQLDQHVQRAHRGIRVQDQVFEAEEVELPPPDAPGVARLEITTARWSLPRSFRLDADGLHQPPVEPPLAEDRVQEVMPQHWRIVLRWSQEALAEAALEMTFWYMEKVGEIHLIDRPSEWADMTPAKAGRNSAKQMLYYALLRAPERSLFERQAIALYNAYGFGYSLGMNFIGPGRRRRMLWFDDLREILETGRTKEGARLRGYSPVADP